MSIRYSKPFLSRLPSGPVGGIVCMLSGIIFLILSDATAKWLIPWYPVPEIIALRALVVIVLLLLLLHKRANVLRIVRWQGHALRAVFACLSGFLFVYGLGFLPLADASAAAFSGPLFLTALAGPVLSERVGWRRWSAVIAGFAGVLIMLRPFSAGIQWAILLPVSATLCGAVRDLITRHISQWESPESILLTTNILLLVAGMAALPGTWTVPAGSHVILITASGLALGTAHYLHIQAFRLTEASALAPFRYTSIIWSVLLGYLLWGQLPDIWIVTGGGGIIASGLYILHRERRLARATSARSTPPEQ